MEKKIRIEFGDRTRSLRFDINAVAEADLMLKNKSVQELLRQAANGNGLGFHDLRVLLWAGLMHEDRTLSINKDHGLSTVGDMIMKAPGETTMDKLLYVSGKVFEALDTFLGGEKKEEVPTEPTT